MQLAKRVRQLPPYLFVEVSRKIAAKKAQGHDVISFGIGDPDLPTPPHVIEALCQAAHEPANHRYPESDGLPEFRRAIADWYAKRFGISFDPNKEVLPLIGSKEGIAHIALCFIDPGDIALVTDPGYPVYSVGTMFAGGETYYLPVTAENGFLPDLEKMPAEVADKAKILWINYPNNPTGAVAGTEFFERVVHFARRHDLMVCHDGPYSEVSYDGYKPVSFMETPGAREVGVEFHSLSKTYNMTGWRVGMVVGNATAVDALMRVKSNMDSGIPQAIQAMAMAALAGPQQCIEEHNTIYQQRRDKVVAALRHVGCEVFPPKASLYVWARVPTGYNSVSFTTKLLDEADVVVTPGTGYGPSGEGYVRLSITLADDRLEEAVARLNKLR